MKTYTFNGKDKYHDYNYCPICESENKVHVTDSFPGNSIPNEAETECKKCGHQDYWAYGYYEDGGRYTEC